EQAGSPIQPEVGSAPPPRPPPAPPGAGPPAVPLPPHPGTAPPPGPGPPTPLTARPAGYPPASASPRRTPPRPLSHLTLPFHLTGTPPSSGDSAPDGRSRSDRRAIVELSRRPVDRLTDVTRRPLYAAGCLAHLALGLVNLPLGLEPAIAGRLTDRFLDAALGFIGDSLRGVTSVAMHDGHLRN